MDTRPAFNPKPPEQINNRHEHPLKDFLLLAAAGIALLTLLAFLLASSASWIAPYIPYQWEVDYLQNFTLDKHTEETDVPKKEQALSDLLAKLTGPDALTVKVHYLPEETEPNAFATLGGHIFVTQGLLNYVTSENALAMVLAHEYAHIELRHPITLLFEQLSFGLIFSLLGSDNIAQMMAQNTSMLTVLAFSRDMERAADASALQRLKTYYGHTKGADGFFIKIQEKDDFDEANWSAFLQTHPLTQDRIDDIHSSMVQGKLTPLSPELKTPEK